jgi:nitroreductase
MDFFDVVATQRAIRRFRSDPVPDALVRRVLAAATCAPSARGAEPWAFVVVRDPARRAEIARLYLGAWEAAGQFPDATDADHDVKHAPHYGRMMRGADALARDLGTVPVLIVCCLDHARLGPNADGRRPPMPGAAYASILPAVQNCSSPPARSTSVTTLTTSTRVHSRYARCSSCRRRSSPSDRASASRAIAPGPRGGAPSRRSPTSIATVPYL